jgi:biotin carboxyl carrier protein
MKTYHVVVNGKPYIVDIEEIVGGAPQQSPAPAPAPVPVAPQPTKPAPQPQPQPAASPAPPSSAQGVTVITCPMPGTVLKIPVTVGARVKEGEVLLVLEAMKMENEIMAPNDGVISQIAVGVGASVGTGDVLVVM